ncbi:Golgi apyrase [Wickerhamiella sorbophila]|uniref:Golgi apyrase n=1 Tax=Wickerhamiella sorbophila TaxID=45607 RepID=A0A2T0FD59_9ASCO|nr:Golgi apyrase [Wickerhamiella sorbophila]PRT52905.1 Golgi apyrase [Wickerhamiella sorbophila]
MKYAVIVDAGSSGSRVYVYTWPDPAQYLEAVGKSSAVAKTLLPIETKPEWVYKVKPGISSFAGKTDEIWRSHLLALVEKAHQAVPKQDRPYTPFYFLATAGLRLTPEPERKKILDTVCSEVRKHTSFYLPECETHVAMIDGQTEGLYGWLGLNYLVHTHLNLEWSDFTKTYGFMDMGGASAQVAFAPSLSEAERHHDDLYTINVRTIGGDPVNWKVFVTTWLGFGANQAQSRYRQSILESLDEKYWEPLKNGAPLVAPDPCLQPAAMDVQMQKLEGYDQPQEVVYFGTGDYDACKTALEPLLNSGIPCKDEPCLFNGIHVPAFDLEHDKFVGVSEYWYSTSDLFALDGKMDYATFVDRTQNFCTTNWRDIADKYDHGDFGTNFDLETLKKACFKASWVLEILTKGFNFPLDPKDPASKHNFLDTFQSASDIGGKDLTWTLGRAVLYASSQIEAADTYKVGYAGYEQDWVSGGELPGVMSNEEYFAATSGYSKLWLFPMLGVFLFLYAVLAGRTGTKYLPAFVRNRLGQYAKIPKSPSLPVFESANDIPLQEYPHTTSWTPPSRVSSRINMRDWENQ